MTKKLFIRKQVSLLVLLALVAAGLWGIRELREERVPLFSEVRLAASGSGIFLSDRNGRALQQSSWLPLSEISPEFMEQLVAVEDRRFYMHPGWDLLGSLGALRDRILHRHSRASGTISMQTASWIREKFPPAQALPESDRQGLRGKWQALLHSLHKYLFVLKLEGSWSKLEILEAYVNLVPLNQDWVGIESAARGIFQKSPLALNKLEAALLLAFLRAPAAKSAAQAQLACRVLKAQAKMRGVRLDSSDCDMVQDIAEKLQLHALPAPREFAAHFTQFLLPQVMAIPPPGNGGGKGKSSETKFFRTTIDRDLQIYAQNLFAQFFAVKSRSGAREGGALLLDNRSGEALMYVVDGRDPALELQQRDVIREYRPAGAALQPFLYTLAFEQKRILPEAYLEKSPWDGENLHSGYRNFLATGEALVFGLAEPAASLLERVGGGEFSERLQWLGLLSERILDSERLKNLDSLEVNLWDLTNAYRVLANRGIFAPVRVLADLSQEEKLFRYFGRGDVRAKRAVFSPSATFFVSRLLADTSAGRWGRARLPAWTALHRNVQRLQSAQNANVPHDLTGHWCLGFSNRYTLGLWLDSKAAPDDALELWQMLMRHLQTTESKWRAPIALEQLPAKSLALSELERAEALDAAARAVMRASAQESQAGEKNFAGESAYSWRRITYPKAGMVIVLDPDLNSSAQRVRLSAEPRDPTLVWELDGKILGAGTETPLWRPQRGQHILSLKDQGQNIVDEVHFEVR